MHIWFPEHYPAVKHGPVGSLYIEDQKLEHALVIRAFPRAHVQLVTWEVFSRVIGLYLRHVPETRVACDMLCKTTLGRVTCTVHTVTHIHGLVDVEHMIHIARRRANGPPVILSARWQLQHR